MNVTRSGCHQRVKNLTRTRLHLRGVGVAATGLRIVTSPRCPLASGNEGEVVCILTTFFNDVVFVDNCFLLVRLLSHALHSPSHDGHLAKLSIVTTFGNMDGLGCHKFLGTYGQLTTTCDYQRLGGCLRPSHPAIVGLLDVRGHRKGSFLTGCFVSC